MRKFQCRYVFEEEGDLPWEGSWEFINAGSDYEELKIRGRGSCYHLIVGSYTYGNFLCIPEIDIGCALAALDDFFWNYERLSRLLGETDAVTISRALTDFASLK